MRTMRDNFKNVTCKEKKPLHKVCLTQQCHLCPFICSQLPCTCQSIHGPKCNVKTLEQIDQSINTILKFEFFIVYSPDYKGKSIHVAGRYAIQTQPPLFNQRFALTYDPIPKDASQSVSFRLTKIKGCVGVGIFIREVVHSHGYRYVPDPNYLNHGCYMLLSNNMLYSNSDSVANGRSIRKFDVNQKDVIKVKYDKGRVTFISRFMEEYLDVEFSEEQNIHFGVYLYDVEDEVEIVNTFVSGEH